MALQYGLFRRPIRPVWHRLPAAFCNPLHASRLANAPAPYANGIRNVAVWARRPVAAGLKGGFRQRVAIEARRRYGVPAVAARVFVGLPPALAPLAMVSRASGLTWPRGSCHTARRAVAGRALCPAAGGASAPGEGVL